MIAAVPVFALSLAAGGVFVEPRERVLVAFAYRHSPAFRAEFDAATANGDVAVWLGSAAPPELIGAGSRGNTRWHEPPSVIVGGAGRSYRGLIVSRALLAPPLELAARFAHELAHANELARYGSIWRAPGARSAHAGRGLAETENALAVERRVRDELRQAARRRGPSEGLLAAQTGVERGRADRDDEMAESSAATPSTF